MFNRVLNTTLRKTTFAKITHKVYIEENRATYVDIDLLTKLTFLTNPRSCFNAFINGIEDFFQ